MKKHTLLILTNLLLITGVSFATESQSFNGPSNTAFTAPAGVWVKLTVTFHRPKLDCLKGFGLCFDLNWGIEKGGSQNDTEVCPVSMQLEKNQLQMQVAEADLKNYENGSSLQYFQGKPTITLEDDTEIPLRISRELGSTSPIVIKAGVYPVSFQNGTYLVTIQL
ncbi:MAG: hypothetical protein JXA23_06365 [Bacteroidales bacterium]|nr:hypothetical protein [Bacteroidales bacterium]